MPLFAALLRPARTCCFRGSFHLHPMATATAVLRPQIQRQCYHHFLPRQPSLRHVVRLLKGTRRAYATTGKTTGKKLPERLLVYHAGTPRTTFLACLKVTTVFGLAFFTFLIAPAYVAAGKPLLQVIGVAICGIVPFVVVAYTSTPFVVFVHLRLPPFARHPDRTLLRRFVHNVPPATLLDLTTMNFLGRPRVVTHAVADLVPAKERLRIVNLAARNPSSSSSSSSPSSSSLSPSSRSRSPPPSSSSSSTKKPSFFVTSSSFPWIKLREPIWFGAPPGSNSRGVRDAWAWNDIVACIERRAAPSTAKPDGPPSPPQPPPRKR